MRGKLGFHLDKITGWKHIGKKSVPIQVTEWLVPCWPFPVLKYICTFQIKYTEAILSNSTRKLYGLVNIPPHLAYAATLPCQTLMLANVATYLRCGVIVNNHIKKGLLLSLGVKKIKIGEYMAKLLAKTRLSHAHSSSFNSLLAKRAKWWW